MCMKTHLVFQIAILQIDHSKLNAFEYLLECFALFRVQCFVSQNQIECSHLKRVVRLRIANIFEYSNRPINMILLLLFIYLFLIYSLIMFNRLDLFVICQWIEHTNVMNPRKMLTRSKTSMLTACKQKSNGFIKPEMLSTSKFSEETAPKCVDSMCRISGLDAKQWINSDR